MDGYMTTYRQDFIWPYIRTFPISTGDKKLKKTPKKMLGPLEANKPWVRYGPNPPLLDPRMYPGTIGKSPGQIKHPSGSTDKPSIENSLYSKDNRTDGCACWRGLNELALPKDAFPQLTVIPPDSVLTPPSVLLKQLQEKYPYLYNVLKNVPPDELISRLMADRYQTTYSNDFGKQGKHPSDRYDELMIATGLCAPRREITNYLPGIPYRPKIRDKKIIKPSEMINENVKKVNRTDQSAGVRDKPSWLRWQSEYQGNISKLGNVILTEHNPKKKIKKRKY